MTIIPLRRKRNEKGNRKWLATVEVPGGGIEPLTFIQKKTRSLCLWNQRPSVTGCGSLH